MSGRRAGWAVCLVSMFACGTLVHAAPPQVRTANGKLGGVEAGDLAVFRGIPFAAPPIATLRWRAPQPASSWRGVRKADNFSPVCTQRGTYPEHAPAEPAS